MTDKHDAYVLPASLRETLIDFMLRMPMAQVEVGVNALRALKPIVDMSDVAVDVDYDEDDANIPV